jgi:hypothetical protein
MVHARILEARQTEDVVGDEIGILDYSFIDSRLGFCVLTSAPTLPLNPSCRSLSVRSMSQRWCLQNIQFLCGHALVQVFEKGLLMCSLQAPILSV